MCNITSNCYCFSQVLHLWPHWEVWEFAYLDELLSHYLNFEKLYEWKKCIWRSINAILWRKQWQYHNINMIVSTLSYCEQFIGARYSRKTNICPHHPLMKIYQLSLPLKWLSFPNDFTNPSYFHPLPSNHHSVEKHPLNMIQLIPDE